MTAVEDLPPDTVVTRHRDWTWAFVLVGGTLVWLLAAGITVITEDKILVPTVILIGSFLVPVTVITWAMGLPRAGELTPRVVFLGFLTGGTLGVLAAALLETYLLPDDVGTFLSVGLIEESTKALALLGVAHLVRTRGPRDGMVLGAIVGAGFAAFESAGYAFNSVIEHLDDHPIANIMETEFSRAILAPFGHILWTALVGGALFAGVSAAGRFRVTWELVGTFLGVVLLHAAWDASYGTAVVLAQGLVGTGWELEWPNTSSWIGAPTQEDLVVFNAGYDVLLAVNAIIGTWWVVHTYRRHTRLLASGEEHVVALQ
jgi:protease PrsW